MFDPANHVQTHYRVTVPDLEAARAAFMALGLSEPVDAAPVTHRDRDGDAAGITLAPVYGPEWRTQTLRHPRNNQRVQLVEPSARAARAGAAPCAGDLLIGLPVADPDAAAHALERTPGLSGHAEARPADDGVAVRGPGGVALLLTRQRSPFARVLYPAAMLAAARLYYAEVLGAMPVADGQREGRFQLQTVGGRLELEAADVVAAPPDAGKRYPGATGFRLLYQDVRAIRTRLRAGGAGQVLGEPERWVAFVTGPGGELIELVDRGAAGEVTRRVGPFLEPRVPPSYLHYAG